MKSFKIFLLGLFCLSALGNANAQTKKHVYHNVGDTLVGRDTIYFYDWDWAAWANEGNHYNMRRMNAIICHSFLDDYSGGTLQGYGSGTLLRKCYTHEPLKIVGIAGLPFAWNGFDGNTLVNRYSVDTTNLQEYFLLYDAWPDSLHLLAQIPWSIRDPFRYYALGGEDKYFATDCCPDMLTTVHVNCRIYEYYFEGKPFTVTDSFYVGGTTFSDTTDWGDVFHASGLDTVTYYCNYWAIGSSYWDWHYGTCPDVCAESPYAHYRLMPANQSHWIHYDHPYHLCIWPIIGLDDTSFAYHDTNIVPQFHCPPVEDVRMIEFSQQQAVLTWNSRSEHSRYQLCWGPEGSSPEQCQCDSTDGFTLFGGINHLDSCTHYVAYVRAICDNNGHTYYSDWSDPVEIFVCDTSHSNAGVPRPGILEQFTHIVPNPASNNVQVISSFPLSGIEVFDLGGKRMLQMDSEGLAASFDVSLWPKGVYVVAIHCEAGIATKKLVVQ